MDSALVKDLRTLGVQPGNTLMVHASLRSLGTESGGASAVVDDLLEVLGKDGTLLMPALSYATVNAQNPVFDVRNTPSCVGALAEYFRTRPGTMRSVHPTHSVCGVGRRSEEILSHHLHDTTPVGENSPFTRLPKIGGQVLFIGCGLGPNTMMHGVEEKVAPPYLLDGTVAYAVTLADGSHLTMTITGHNFKGWEQHYERLESLLYRGLKRGKLLQADCYLMEADEMWFAALTKLRQTPLFFVDKLGATEVY